MLLHDLLFHRANTHGNDPALLRREIRLTYAEVAAQVRNAASGLHTLGVDRNDRVAVYLDKRIEGIVTYFATSFAGGVFVPINPILKPNQVGHILDDCQVSVLVTSSSHVKTLAPILVNCKSLRHVIVVDDAVETIDLLQVSQHRWCSVVEEPSPECPDIPRIDNDMAAILYTSGSTGRPKGVVLSHRNMTTGAVSVSGYLENSPDDIILAALPLSFDAGFSQLTTAFCAGASVVLMDYLLPQDVPRAMEKFGVTGLTGVPPLWNQLVKFDWPKSIAKNLRYVANTGGAMPTATLEKLRSKLPQTKVYLMYGLTESFRSTYLPPDQLDKRPTSIGRAIPNAEVFVARDDGSICDPGEPGELVHRGALVSLGYWNDPERSSTRFRPVPGSIEELPFDELAVWSGDTVVKDDEGYLYFVGRKDDMIKSSGYRISPTEVEEVVFDTGKVTECVALGIPHPEIGQAVVIVATSRYAGDETEQHIISTFKSSVPNYMVPARVVWRDVLPKNPNGKIDRKSLVAELATLFQEES